MVLPGIAFLFITKKMNNIVENEQIKCYNMLQQTLYKTGLEIFMFLLLLLTLSYGAFLILLMPATGTGILSVSVIFALGLSSMIFKKVHQIHFWKNKQYSLLATSALIVPYLGFAFYTRWLPSSKMQAIAGLLHISVETWLLMCSIALSVFSIYFIYIALQMISKMQNNYVKSLICSLIAAVITVILAQIIVNIPVLSMGFLKFLWGILIVATAILFIYCLSGKIMPAVFLGAGFFMVISTVNVYVYRFRGRLFEPVDIFSAGTAMNVAENYNLFPIPPKVLLCWGIFATLLIAFYFIQQKDKQSLSLKSRFALLAACVISFSAIFVCASNLKTYHWQKQGVNFNGYILDFVAKFKEISVTEPDNYSNELITSLADQYSTNDDVCKSSVTNSPHIFVVMDEAFSDLSVVGELSTNAEVMPFISSLKENTISGYTLASVYGGNTANSEYEFLTGNSLAFLSPNVVPYQQYVRSSTYSMVSYLKSTYDYKCLAMHPFHANGWNRPSAYGHLGFDECFFLEDFPQKDLVREYVSDREMFNYLIETYEAHKHDPLFIWGVTMQNHGGYAYTGENFTQSIFLKEHPGKFPEVEQYLSLIHETDKAVEQLITYFENVEEDVIIVFYGDHQPGIDESFYETISGTTASTLDEQQKRYLVPFFIWANYDIDEQYIERTSLNYLSSYVYDVAGIDLPPYNRFLRDMEDVIPAVNANGFYSPEKGCYLPFEEATGEAQQWLDTYEALQYNNIFDKANQNKVLFPVLE